MQRVIPASISLLILALVLVLPLVGGLFAGRPLAEFTQFPPPLEVSTGYVRFSWLAVGAVGASLAVVAWAWFVGRRLPAPAREKFAAGTTAGPRVFPAWGWAALAWTLAWWTLAWTRWAWFAPLQAYTFFPLWIGFIVTVNAASQRRSGSCLMRRAPRQWFALFAASARVGGASNGSTASSGTGTT